MIQQNVREFQESITKELITTKDRVRNLIGGINWSDDGRYKEAILRKMILQFLPNNLSIGTGFIVANYSENFETDNHTSSQLDIIIYDDRIPVVFREGDFVILTEKSVRAIIEVKTKIKGGDSDKNSLTKIVQKLNNLKQFKTFSEKKKKKELFVGVFSYEYNESLDETNAEIALRESDGFVNHLSLGTNKFIKYWKENSGLPCIDNKSRCYIQYRIENLSFSYFISNLLHIVSDKEPIERAWLSFPIKETKELHREGEVIYLETKT